MLCQITFENFKLLQQQAFLDLFAESLKEHEKSLIKDPFDGESFLPVIALFGPDSSTQDVLDCFLQLNRMVVNPIEAITGSFDILFRVDKYEYRYIIKAKGVIKEEYLYGKELTTKECFILFERIKNDLYIGDRLKEQNNLNLSINPFMPILSTLKENDIIKEVLAWFSKIKFLESEDLNERNISEGLKNGDFVIAQRLDKCFSTDQIKGFINRFSDPLCNKKNAQLIFTCHDEKIMNKSLLRRDEIWFSTINKKGQSKLYSLVDFKPDSVTDYEKSYREGFFGDLLDGTKGEQP